jgi:hypothetical protein
MPLPNVSTQLAVPAAAGLAVKELEILLDRVFFPNLVDQVLPERPPVPSK